MEKGEEIKFDRSSEKWRSVHREEGKEYPAYNRKK